MNKSCMAVILLGVVVTGALLVPAYGAAISISGTVKDAEGKTVSGAAVYAMSDAGVKTTAGADGSFTLNGAVANAPDGKVAVAAAKDGLMTAQVLAPNASAKGVQFKLYPSIIGQSVTLMGNRMNETHLRELAQWNSKGGKKGDDLKISWLDNKGATDTMTAKIQ